MKALALTALCFLSSFACATDIEEVVVKARRIEIIMVKLAEKHQQDPATGDWYYVEQKKELNKEQKKKT